MSQRTTLLQVVIASALVGSLQASCKPDGGPVDLGDPMDLSMPAVSDLGRPDLGRTDLGRTDFGVPEDLAVPKDLLVPADLPLLSDLTVLGDMPKPTDLPFMPDLTGPTDLPKPTDLPLGWDMPLVTDLAIPPDLPVPGDLRGATDLAIPPDLPVPGDLAGTVDLAAPLCRGGSAPGTLRQFATHTLTLPTTAAPVSADLDGDGRPDNQLRNLVSAFSTAGIDPQIQLDDSVRSGQLVYLLGIKSTTLDTLCAGVLLNRAARPMMPPKFDGTDVFAALLPASAQLTGALPLGQLSTTLPKDLSAAAEATLPLTLVLGPLTVPLPLRGVHVQGTVETVAGKLVIRNGQLHGAVSSKDIDMQVFPAVAAGLTVMINSDPMSTTTRTLISLIESTTSPVSVAKCMVAADCCRTSPSTCRILPEEVKATLIGALFAPDVEVLNAMDQWEPVRGGTNKDAFSVGLGFSAVQATF